MDDYQAAPKVAPVIPQFFTEPELMTFKSKEAGRPIYEEREFVKIIVPGNRGSVAVEPVNEDHKARWPKEYDAFKKGLELVSEGTPLAKWPPISRAQAEEFKHFHVHTVEQLAALNDVQMQHMGIGVRELRRAAQVFLDSAKNGTGPLLKLVASLEAAELRNEMQDRTIAELAAKVEQLEKSNARAG